MCRAPEIVVDHVYTDPLTGEQIDIYRCMNCDRGAHKCPRCETVRCDHDLFMSMVGSFPLACRFCAEDVQQTYAMGPGGIYAGGNELRYHIVERSPDA